MPVVTVFWTYMVLLVSSGPVNGASLDSTTKAPCGNETLEIYEYEIGDEDDLSFEVDSISL